MNITKPPSPKLTTNEVIDREAELFRAQSVARGIVFYAGPFGIKARKINEEPGETKQSWLKGRITGRLTK